MLSTKFLILINLNLLLILTTNANKSTKYNDICLTPTCVKEAAKILDLIDENISPCDDFYAFTCKKWIDSTVLPEHKSSITRFSELQDEINFKLKGLLEKTSMETEKRDFVIKAKSYYKSCMNTTLINKLKSKPLTDLLTLLGEWPVVEKTKWPEIPWTDLIIRLRKLGLKSNVLFSLSVGTDIRNNSRKILILDQPSLGLNRESLLKGVNDSSVSAYKNLMIKTAIKLGGIKYFVNDSINEILKFETKLANFFTNKIESRDLTLAYNRMTIKRLNNMSSHIDWLKIIRNFTSDTVTEDEEIVIYDASYISSLNLLLKKTKSRLIDSYIIWRVIQSKIGSLSNDWAELNVEFNSIVYGTIKPSPRWELCFSVLNSAMELALSNLFVENFLDETNRGKALKIVTNVKNEFNNTLKNVGWVKGETLKHALKKLEKMKLLVGYPEELIDNSKISAYYELLNLTSDDFFGNRQKVTKWTTDLLFNGLREPNDLNDWTELGFVAQANNGYDVEKNMVIIYAGILQGIFYNQNRPNYLNYGTIGKSAGHEVTHGFDNFGRKYDENGELDNWWDSEMNEMFLAKAQCFIDQYNSFTVEEIGMNVDGVNTLGENIADNGGIKIAFRAYLNYIKNNGPELLLPGLEYTPEQLFWISYGVHYCAKQTNEFLKIKVQTDPHTPNRQRVNGALSNSEYFSKSFNCSNGSPMNPIDKCILW